MDFFKVLQNIIIQLKSISKECSKMENKLLACVNSFGLLKNCKIDQNNWNSCIETVIRYFQPLNNKPEQIESYQYISILRKSLRVILDVIDAQGLYELVFIESTKDMNSFLELHPDTIFFKECLKVYNLCLSKVSTNVTTVAAHPICHKLLKIITEACDIEIQLLLTETMTRLLVRKNVDIIDFFVDSPQLKQTFEKINVDQPNYGIRRFLELLNNQQNNIFSVPCKQVIINKKKVITEFTVGEENIQLFLDFDLVHHIISFRIPTGILTIDIEKPFDLTETLKFSPKILSKLIITYAAEISCSVLSFDLKTSDLELTPFSESKTLSFSFFISQDYSNISYFLKNILPDFSKDSPSVISTSALVDVNFNYLPFDKTQSLMSLTTTSLGATSLSMQTLEACESTLNGTSYSLAMDADVSFINENSLGKIGNYDEAENHNNLINDKFNFSLAATELSIETLGSTDLENKKENILNNAEIKSNNLIKNQTNILPKKSSPVSCTRKTGNTQIRNNNYTINCKRKRNEPSNSKKVLVKIPLVKLKHMKNILKLENNILKSNRANFTKNSLKSSKLEKKISHGPPCSMNGNNNCSKPKRTLYKLDNTVFHDNASKYLENCSSEFLPNIEKNININKNSSKIRLTATQSVKSGISSPTISQKAIKISCNDNLTKIGDAETNQCMLEFSSSNIKILAGLFYQPSKLHQTCNCKRLYKDFVVNLLQHMIAHHPEINKVILKNIVKKLNGKVFRK